MFVKIWWIARHCKISLRNTGEWSQEQSASVAQTRNLAKTAHAWNPHRDIRHMAFTLTHLEHRVQVGATWSMYR